MAAQLPYMLSTGLISRILEKIQNARRPERFTQDFLETKLGQSGGSARAIIPLLKRMGFLSPDGSPTMLYDQFRGSETCEVAIAEGMKNGYKELFDRNEYVYSMTRDKLTSLVVEVTGGTKKDTKTRGIVGTFWTLKRMANFEDDSPSQPSEDPPSPPSAVSPVDPRATIATSARGIDRDRNDYSKDSVDLNVSYTINLNLPETTNPDVFTAIFKALRENLLRN